MLFTRVLKVQKLKISFGPLGYHVVKNVALLPILSPYRFERIQEQK